MAKSKAEDESNWLHLFTWTILIPTNHDVKWFSFYHNLVCGIASSKKPVFLIVLLLNHFSWHYLTLDMSDINKHWKLGSIYLDQFISHLDEFS